MTVYIEITKKALQKRLFNDMDSSKSYFTKDFTADPFADFRLIM